MQTIIARHSHAKIDAAVQSRLMPVGGVLGTYRLHHLFPRAQAKLVADAVLHFFAKNRIAPEDVGWGSGFDLLLRSFSPLAQPGLVFDSFLSWLIVGLILSLTRVLTGNIAVAIGLHAGWVIVLRMLQEGTTGGAAPRYSFWVGRFDGLLGYWLLPWGICIAITLWLTRTRWVPQARSDFAPRLS